MSKNHDFFYDEPSRDGEGLFLGHEQGLYDQNENTAGERIDPATGRPFNNSSHSYDNLGNLSAEEAAELGFTITDGSEYDSDDTIDFSNHWGDLQDGLADAAERGIFLSDEDIA